jgi:hypothetical protein
MYFSLYPFDETTSALTTQVTTSQSPLENLNAPAMTSTASGATSVVETSQAPSTFQLVHIRIPPNIELSSQNGKGPISTAYSNNGITLMISKLDEHIDSVMLLNRDLFLLHNTFKESKSIFDIEGRVWAVEEIVPGINSIRSGANENELLHTAKSASGIQNIPKLTAEFFDLPRRFTMITPQVN